MYDTVDTLLHIFDHVKYGLLLLPLMIWAVKEWLHRDHRSDKNLRGRVALVTGGSVGIGYETALELARRGAEVVVASRSLRKVRWHPFITFAKFSGFWTPSPLVCMLARSIELNPRNLPY